ncbi:MAG: DUF4368 domain-containing protein [Oscillospiraceae bacterium]
MERIVVHERSERWKKKNYTQKVDIYFNYIGNLDKGAEGAPEGTPSAGKLKNIFILRRGTGQRTFLTEIIFSGHPC